MLALLRPTGSLPHRTIDGSLCCKTMRRGTCLVPYHNYEDEVVRLVLSPDTIKAKTFRTRHPYQLVQIEYIFC